MDWLLIVCLVILAMVLIIGLSPYIWYMICKIQMAAWLRTAKNYQKERKESNETISKGK